MDLLLIVLVAVLAAAVLMVLWNWRKTSGSTSSESESASVAPSVLRERLEKTRHALADRLAALSQGGLDAGFWSDMESVLITADVGIETSEDLVRVVRDQSPTDADMARELLQDELVHVLERRNRELRLIGKPAIVLVVGVNGGGKTTSTAKLAALLQRDGSKVLLGSADTFRAAADHQLRTWADRVGVDIVGGQAGADPAAVAYDAYNAAKARGVDAVIVDTAGRLQSRSNLMDELSKVARVLRREAGDLDEVLLVIDGTTGQNAIAQAHSFSEAVGVTGIVITKLDGTAKGGVVVAIERELDLPVKFIGVGEGVEDLIRFDPQEFVDALLAS